METLGSSLGQSGAASTMEGRAFLQERISFYCKAMMFVFAGLYAFTLGVWQLFPALRPGEATLAALTGFAALAIIIGARLYTRGMVREAGALRAIDAVVLLSSAVFLAAGAYAARYSAPNVYTAFLFTAFLILARVPIVPSSGMRTLVLSLAAWIPIVAVGTAMAIEFSDPMAMPGPVFVGGMSLFVVIAVAIATVGSDVIYGLRKEVREAMQLGQYKLTEKLGEGGMGVVYKGSHAMLRRPAAIKLLSPERAGAQNVIRFEREVQLTAQLTHANTVAVYDYGRSPNGVFYYAMEYLEGTDLETLVADRGPQPAARVIHILKQVCGALDEAHNLGLIHRDIKPANIILCKRGGAPDVAKVVDFGLAKEIESSELLGEEFDPRATSADVVAGTPAYLAPESITAPADVSGQVDIYALGAVGYFLLTGVAVFVGKTVMEVCSHHALTAPTPPSERTDRPIPADLEALLLRCLEKDPAQRPGSAGALRVELSKLDDAGRWSEEVANLWWDRWFADRELALANTEERLAAPVDLTIDIGTRSEIQR